MSHAALATVLAGIMLVALNAYMLLAGADFGGGVWDLFASGPRRDRQRELIAKAMGPVWEANHVWLILAVVLLFTCFPLVFGRLAVALHIPLSLMLVGIVLRGSAFIFRSYDTHHDMAQRRWGRLFSVASLVTPFLLGVSVGAVASGRVQSPGGRDFAAAYLSPWLTPFALSIGLLTVALFAFLAAVYLTMEAVEPALKEDFRRRALIAGGLCLLTAILTLFAARRDAPLMEEGLLGSARAVPIHLLTGAWAVTALAALWTRRWRLARIAAAAQVTCIVWGWAVAQYPYILPPEMTIVAAAAPMTTLELTLAILALGAVVLLPSLAYLFKVFKSQKAEWAERAEGEIPLAILWSPGIDTEARSALWRVS
jgi:cytochrome d ubiquinol oxidase subunit II